MTRKIIAILPFALILIVLIFYFTEGIHLFNFETIQKEHVKWTAFVDEHPLLSAIYFMGIYIVSVILILPDSIFLSVLGGFLFPMPLAIAYVCISETVGATIFFLAVKLAYTETIGEKQNDALNEMRLKIHGHQVYYLLFLRFSHLLPFWLINAGAGIFHVRTLTFIWTTLVGVLPLTFFLVEGGSGLSKYIDTHTQFRIMDLFTPQVKIALVALGCFALLPLLYKKPKSESLLSLFYNKLKSKSMFKSKKKWWFK